MNRVRSIFFVVFALSCQSLLASHADKLNAFLAKHQIRECTEHFQAEIKRDPNDHDARLALGLTQFFRSIESLAQDLTASGIRESRLRTFVPILRMPVESKLPASPINYEQLRAVFARFQKGLAEADKTLDPVDTQNCKLLIDLGNIPLDLDADGIIGENEVFHQLMSLFNPGLGNTDAFKVKIGFDGGDVHWLRGYMHLLMAFCDFFLAYDHREIFERCGQLFFRKIDSPYLSAKLHSDDQEFYGYSSEEIADAIAAIHLLRFPLMDRQRMANAHSHLLTVIAQSRLSWKRVMSETDNDHEWIPNPKQKSILGIDVPREFVTGWEKVINELETILQGKKMAFHWRVSTQVLPGDTQPIMKGINMKKFFLEPRDFDLVLAAQGTGLEPYLEEGPISDPESWNRLTRIFRGQFFGFAVWFN